MQQSEVFIWPHQSINPHIRRNRRVVSFLSGWAQQGVQTFFATQRIILDLAMRQNANVMHIVRQQLSDPHHSPSAILGEMAGEGINNFLEGQKALLDLGKQQNEIFDDRCEGARRRLPTASCRHSICCGASVDTYIQMQEEFLKIAGKQTHAWVESAKAGKPSSRPSGGCGPRGDG